MQGAADLAPGERRFRDALEAGDVEEMTSALTPDAVLHSPVSFRPFEGREAISELFAALVATFEDFRYVEELSSADGGRALRFRARVGQRELEGVDLLRFDADGKIVELTVLVRPASGLAALGEAVARRLAPAER